MSGALKKVSFINTFINTAKPNLQTFVKYAKVELTPPKFSDLPEIKNEISKIIQTAKTGRWKNITVKDATVNSLVAIEVLMWFYLGECIGKRHLVGYNIKL
ncbi:ATP synthase, F0 complex, subunit G, mitochondrial,Mitochondrial ATP synthase subunit g [Cinara cedri]|uniref:ATP synthase subunit g n=1 Tax=Cinara cedri TaxID=506608 RepID=A0A5E4M3R2_9HEMI|nr:ATP synthase, F0 complex, subunit G, mitochondrial,Mitochondrial ATP synthase subunit g [Cinara cedri]